jgi:hypothetical protein
LAEKLFKYLVTYCIGKGKGEQRMKIIRQNPYEFLEEDNVEKDEKKNEKKANPKKEN